uniref:C2H2-type domain-containing protein n=1 Tax=Cacopsylla melanoneura TaxID=428564 RepID=A0A8D8WW30_9HEMI
MFDYKLSQMNAREMAIRAKKTHNDTGVFQCPTPHCSRIYSRRRSLNRHKQECGQLPRYKCTLCPYRGKRKDSLKSHMVHGHKIIDQQLQEQFMNRENRTYEDDELARNDDIGNVYEEWSRRQLEGMRRELGDVDENEPGAVDSVLNNKDNGEEKAAADRLEEDLVYQVDYRGQVKFFEQTKPSFDQNDIRDDKDPLGHSENELQVGATNENGSKITSPINLCVSK